MTIRLRMSELQIGIGGGKMSQILLIDDFVWWARSKDHLLLRHVAKFSKMQFRNSFKNAIKILKIFPKMDSRDFLCNKKKLKKIYFIIHIIIIIHIYYYYLSSIETFSGMHL